MKLCTQQSTDSAVPEWLISLIDQWDKSCASVITLNYDTLVEQAVKNRCPHLDISQMYPPYLSSIEKHVRTPLINERHETFTYFKLHGSVNGHYPGRPDFYGETIYYSDVPPWGSNSSGEESQVYADKETLIAPPVTEKSIFFNNESIRKQWQQASTALQAAKNVFVIGYSPPKSDLGMQFFIMRNQPIIGTPWYIIDKDCGVIDRYRELLTSSGARPSHTIHADFIHNENPLPRFVESYPNL